ncbi:MAG: tetratricopeptide repeat protein [Planctomycetes bacterium]|nr:tetratricopeptide repeat protein [Planctomycetota bacterium]
MSITVRCHCGQSVRLSDDKVAQRLICPRCQQGLELPLPAPDVSGERKAETSLPPLADTSSDVPDDPEMHLARGNIHFSLKRYEEAEAAYNQAIQIDPEYANAHVGLGNAYYFLERFQRAAAAFEEAASLDPDDAEAYRGLADSLIELRQYEKAATAFKQAIRLDPENALAHRRLGCALVSLKRYEDAATEYKEAIRLDPGDVESYSSLGYAYHNLKRYEEEVAAYRVAIRLKPEDGNAYFGLRDAYRSLKRYEEEAAVCKQIICLSPGNGVSHSNLGYALVSLKRYEEAETEYKEAIRLKPEYALAHRGLGYALLSLKRYEEAAKAFKEAIRLQPDYALAHRGLGECYGWLQCYDESIAAFEQTIRLKPEDADTHRGLGYAYGWLNRYDDAIAAFEEAIRLNPDYAIAHRGLGEAYGCLDRYEEAAAAYKQAIHLNPADAEAHRGLDAANKGLAELELRSQARDVRDPMAPVVKPIPPKKKWYMQAEDGQTFGPVDRQQLDTWFAERRITAGCYLWQDGDKQMRYAADVYPQLAAVATQAMPEIVTTPKSVASNVTIDNPKSHGDRGRAYLDMERYEEAAAAFKQAIRLDPDNAEWHIGLGRACLLRDQFLEAVAAFEKAIQHEHSNVDAHLGLGHSYSSIGKCEEAAAAFQMVLRYDPTNANARSALESNAKVRRILNEMNLQTVPEELLRLLSTGNGGRHEEVRKVSRGSPNVFEGGLSINEVESLSSLGKRLIASSGYGAVTDYNKAQLLHATTPNVSNAWTHVVPVLAKYANSEGKRSLFGRDKGEIAYRDLEEKLRLVVLGLYGDRLVSRGASTDECLLAVLRSLVSFKEVYPNWEDAYSAGYRVFLEGGGKMKIRPILARHQRAVEAELF